MPIWDAIVRADWRSRLDDAAAGSLAAFADKVLFSPALRRIYSNALKHSDKSLLEALLAEMRVSVNVTGEDLCRIPAQGPVLVIANHPFGILDGVVLGATLLRIRSDVKIVTNSLLQKIPELRQNCIFVDPFNRRNSRQANASGLKRAISHLRTGGMVAVFPAGEVSHWQFEHGEITDPEWNRSVTMLARLTGASVLPALFLGSNSMPYHALGMVHPMIRTIQLPHQFVNKAGRSVELRIGTPIPAARIERISDNVAATRYLRWRTYLLRRRPPHGNTPAPSRILPLVRRAPFKTIAAEIAPSRLQAEIQSLSGEHIVEETQDFTVLVTERAFTPDLVLEIGRLREITFREVAEGTGKERDLDSFDQYYKHLVLWHKEKQQIAGAYRFTNTREVLRDHGVRGLYTSTLFHYRPWLFEQLGPALELGRSFVRLEYQKSYAPLLMLWKGIARYIASHPETAVLFGAVSISNGYQKASRELLVQYFQSQPPHRLSALVRPRRMFRPRPLRGWELEIMRDLLDLEEVSTSIAHIEEDGKGIPVLLRQYLKLGGELLSFNIDRSFSDALDGLILVDLRKTDPARLATYMGKAGVAAFRQYHEISSVA